MVELLPSKYEALSLNPSYLQKPKLQKPKQKASKHKHIESQYVSAACVIGHIRCHLGVPGCLQRILDKCISDVVAFSW
jgi:hypothetical protein